MNHRKLATALMTVLLAGICTATGADDGVYRVSAKLSHQGQVFGSPTIMLKAGQEGSVEVGGPDGQQQDDFKLTIEVTEADDKKLQLATQLESAHGHIAPVLTMPRGEPVMVSVDGLQIELTADYLDAEAFQKYRAAVMRGKSPAAPL